MNLTPRIRVREVHIVQQDDGATWASSQVSIVENLDDAGVIVTASYLPPAPLAIADIGEVLSPAFIDLANQRDAAEAAKAEAQAATVAAEAAMAAMETELTGEVAQREHERDQAIGERDQARAQIAALQAQVAELGQQVAAQQLLLIGQPAPTG